MNAAILTVRVWNRFDEIMVDVRLDDPTTQPDFKSAAEAVHETSVALTQAMNPIPTVAS